MKRRTGGALRTKRLEVLNSHMVDLTVSSWGGVGMSWCQVRRCRSSGTSSVYLCIRVERGISQVLVILRG